MCWNNEWYEDTYELQIINKDQLTAFQKSSLLRKLVFTFYAKGFQIQALEVPLLTRSPIACSCCLLHSKESSISF